jgi:two-component system, response regulator RpfG
VPVCDSHAAYWLEKRDRETVATIRIKSVPFESQLLLRFGGWDDAAQMVFEHHEHFDSLGYPNAISGQKIHSGGRIFSIVDTFCSIITEHSDRCVKKTLLSAISEINANSETQFDPGMGQVFHHVVRRMMMKSTQ